MIILACLGLGLILRVLSGRALMGLSTVRLRGEGLLVCLLAVQMVLPALRLSAELGRVGFVVWLATFPVLAAITISNRHQPGMLVIGIGLLLNLAVVALNGGMPVFSVAVRAAGSVSQLVIPSGDFIHVIGAAGTRLSWLADVIPMPGPSWMRLVPSAGDCLLYVGVVSFVATAGDASTRTT